MWRMKLGKTVYKMTNYNKYYMKLPKSLKKGSKFHQNTQLKKNIENIVNYLFQAETKLNIAFTYGFYL